MNWQFNDFLITDDRAKAHPESIKKLLSGSYWAADRTLETIKKTIINSLCLSVYHNEEQIGYARIVTDYTVFAWIADVIIAPEYRGKGLGKKIMEIIQDHPLIPKSLQVLRTKDAHGLYEQYGFIRSEFMSKKG